MAQVRLAVEVHFATLPAVLQTLSKPHQYLKIIYRPLRTDVLRTTSGQWVSLDFEATASRVCAVQNIRLLA